MSDVALGAVVAFVVFGGLIYLANRFNESEIRRTTRERIRAMAARDLTDLEVRGDVIEGVRDGVSIRIEGGSRPGTRTDEVPITTSASPIDGRLAPFRLEALATEADARARLGREGLAGDTLTRHASLLGGGSVVCDGATIEARTTKSYALRDAIAVVAELARAPERTLARIAEAAGVERARVKGGALRLGRDARPVTITIDRGVRLVIDATPLEGLEGGSVDAAIASLGDHVRRPELEALASELRGRIEVGPGVSLTLPLATPPEQVLRAVELVDRLTETERGAFR